MKEQREENQLHLLHHEGSIWPLQGPLSEHKEGPIWKNENQFHFHVCSYLFGISRSVSHFLEALILSWIDMTQHRCNIVLEGEARLCYRYLCGSNAI